jgi:hypothetical protein
MSNTGAWKQNADLRDIVALAAWVLQLYKDVDPSHQRLKSEISKDFDTIWLGVISPMLLD